MALFDRRPYPYHEICPTNISVPPDGRDKVGMRIYLIQIRDPSGEIVWQTIQNDLPATLDLQSAFILRAGVEYRLTMESAVYVYDDATGALIKKTSNT